MYVICICGESNSDTSKECRKFCQDHFGSQCGHYYKDAKHQFAADGDDDDKPRTCSVPGHRDCSKTHKPGDAMCWLFGPPCPPWSRLWYKKGSTKATSAPAQHPA